MRKRKRKNAMRKKALKPKSEIHILSIYELNNMYRKKKATEEKRRAFGAPSERMWYNYNNKKSIFVVRKNTERLEFMLSMSMYK